MKGAVKIAVTGGGAAGIMAALTAAQHGAEVTIFEKNDRIGKKILSTGNGRCNLGNLEFNMEQYYCDDKDKLSRIFRVFSVWDSMLFFENSGLMIKNKNGYLYPYSEQATAVLDILRMLLTERGVKIETGVTITEVDFCSENNSFVLTDQNEDKYEFQKVILSCGSPASLKRGEGMSGYRIASALGHEIKKVVPGLVQLRSDETFIRALAGIRCQAGIRLLIDGEEAASEMGELQFTSYGISGIPVFQLSRIASYAMEAGSKIQVVVDFFPDQEENAYLYMGRLRYEAQADRSLEDFLIGTVNKKISRVLLKRQGLEPNAKTSEVGWQRVCDLMKMYRNFAIHICGVNSIENAQICAGGVSLSQISTEMESGLVDGLYFAGEMVDVDGKCGGYNLQWAWTSGYIAGRNAAGDSTRDIAENAKEQEVAADAEN